MIASFAPLRGITRVAMAAFGFSLLALMTPSAQAQGGGTPAQPTQYTEVPVPKGEESTGAMRVLEAICWYIPNRIMDLTDIPRLHVAVGDGMGASIRMTKWFFWASWFQSDTWNLGWTKRTPPFWGEQINERYFRLLAAEHQHYDLDRDRDPTEVGLSFHFIVLGANLALSLGEAVDLLTGIVGVDIYGDDKGPVMYDYVVEEEPVEEEAAVDPAAASPAP